MTRFGYTLMTEQSGPKRAGRLRPAGRAPRLRLRGLERPLLAVADRAGPRAARLDGARRGRAGDRAGRPHDLRDLPDPALPPRRGGAEGGDAPDPRRRPVHAGPGQRREPQRARRRPALAGAWPSGRRCSSRRSTSSASCTPATSSTTAALTSRSTPPASGTSPTRASHSPSRSPGSGRSRPSPRWPTTSSPSSPTPRRSRPGTAPTAPPASATAPAPSARSRSAGARTPTRRSSWPTSSSAGSRAAGRSTPTCPPRPGSPGATQFVTPDDVAENIPCGPDLDAIVEAVSAFWKAGFTDVALVQVGDARQEQFLDEAAGPLLEKLRAAAP